MLPWPYHVFLSANHFWIVEKINLKLFLLKTLKQQSFVTNHKNALEVGTFWSTKDNYHCYFLKNGLISMCVTLTLSISASVPLTCLADSSSRLDLLLPQSRKNKFHCMNLSITAPLYLSFLLFQAVFLSFWNSTLNSLWFVGALIDGIEVGEEMTGASGQSFSSAPSGLQWVVPSHLSCMGIW